MYMGEATCTVSDILLQVSSWKSSRGSCRDKCCKKVLKKVVGNHSFQEEAVFRELVSSGVCTENCLSL